MPVPPGKDNSVKVALIGMAGVILAALIGYFATRPTTSDLVAYAGTVKDAKTHKPLRNALVGITEDQNIPQRFTTDSEGVFFARLSKATQTMLLEITADGYQDYSRRGPTVRTGTEDIFLEPVSPPPDPSRDAEARKILSDYAARLHDLDRLVKEADNSTDIETKGGIAFSFTESLMARRNTEHRCPNSRMYLGQRSSGNWRKLEFPIAPSTPSKQPTH
jgi:hypothetical protein